MANLVITVISIALVAVAALMGAYYGGSAFMGGQEKAVATQIISQVEQMRSAALMWQLDNPGLRYPGVGIYTDWNTALNGKYITANPVPKISGEAAGINQIGVITTTDGVPYVAWSFIVAANANRWYTREQVSINICKKINEIRNNNVTTMTTGGEGNLTGLPELYSTPGKMIYRYYASPGEADVSSSLTPGVNQCFLEMNYFGGHLNFLLKV